MVNKTQQLYEDAKKLIPGGTQLLTKRPEMTLPDFWPAYYDRADGCTIWDLDGNKYTDMSYMGIGSCILGYANLTVDDAVVKAIGRGSMSTLNCPEEVELAKLLCDLHPWASKVRYARTGGEAMAVAVRIARAKTGKDKVMFCGYHGWHDWYLSTNLNKDNLNGHLIPGLSPKGVPEGLSGTSLPFYYNNISMFLSTFHYHRDKIAAVVMEPLRNHFPEDDFLAIIRDETRKYNVPLIFDEITSGWRMAHGGAHIALGVWPDIAVFAKAMSNGYPMAAIIGKSDVMDAAQDTFISSTYWTERIGPVAALATINRLVDGNIPAYLKIVGLRVQEAWECMAKKHDIKIDITGIPQLSHFDFKHFAFAKDNLIFKTLFSQYMLEQGFLATNAFYASDAHGLQIIQQYEDAVDVSFGKIKKAIQSGNPEKFLNGPVCHSGFQRLT